MNWKLILMLSLFGLAMAVGTVFVIPTNVEPIIWLPIFIVCAVIIAKRAPGKYFLHGFLLGLANCVWVTGFHFAMFDTYLVHHVREAAMMKSTPLPIPARFTMLIAGPIIGILSGLIIGLFAFIAHKITGSKRVAPATPAAPAA
jgi:hypothetical protein